MVIKTITMLGILFIYFIGKYFYELAKSYEKSAWLFAVLGIVSYYLGGFLLALTLVFAAALMEVDLYDSMGETAIGLTVIPFGLISCYLFYYILKRNWSKNFKVELDEIDEIGKPETQL